MSSLASYSQWLKGPALLWKTLIDHKKVNKRNHASKEISTLFKEDGINQVGCRIRQSTYSRNKYQEPNESAHISPYYRVGDRSLS